MNNNTRWADSITKEMCELEILCVFQYYPPTKTFEDNDGWKMGTKADDIWYQEKIWEKNQG